MNKVIISILLLMFLMFWLILNPISRSYWDNVGYEMDKTLNPNKYQQNED